MFQIPFYDWLKQYQECMYLFGCTLNGDFKYSHEITELWNVWFCLTCRLLTPVAWWVLMLSTRQAWADDRSKNDTKFSIYWMSLLYFESQWKMHTYKYKHARYRFINSLNKSEKLFKNLDALSTVISNIVMKLQNCEMCDFVWPVVCSRLSRDES